MKKTGFEIALWGLLAASQTVLGEAPYFSAETLDVEVVISDEQQFIPDVKTYFHRDVSNENLAYGWDLQYHQWPDGWIIFYCDPQRCNDPRATAGSFAMIDADSMPIDSGEYARKINDPSAANGMLFNDGVLNVSEYHSMIYAHVAALGAKYRLNARHSLKGNVEHLSTAQDRGSWLAGTLEWQGRRFSAFISDDYNYGNSDPAKRLNYYSLGGTVTVRTTRFSLSYGRRRAGIICTGGVCRSVPALNGLAATLSTSF